MSPSSDLAGESAQVRKACRKRVTACRVTRSGVLACSRLKSIPDSSAMLRTFLRQLSVVV